MYVFKIKILTNIVIIHYLIGGRRAIDSDGNYHKDRYMFNIVVLPPFLF